MQRSPGEGAEPPAPQNDSATAPSVARPGRPSAGAGTIVRPPIRPEMTTRQLAADYPACQEVLRRYGEPEGRPTRFGHLEPLTSFASRQGIDREQLLIELAQAAGVDIDRDSGRAERVHRPFIAWALANTLSLGAGWGALLLLEIGRTGRFEAVPANHVVAHGAAQLWGFIALFVVGIALRQLPTASGGPRAGITFSRGLLAAFLAGVTGGFVWSLVPEKAGWLGPASGVPLVLAALMFLGFLLRRLAGKFRYSWSRQIAAAGVWMVVWAGVTLLCRGRVLHDGPGAYSESTRQLLMELALFGFTLNAIYGFGQKLLSGIVGSGTPRSGALETTFWFHNGGVALLSLSHAAWPSVAGPLGIILLAVAAFSYALGMRGFLRTRRSSSRPEAGQGILRCYVQLAFFWLLAGMTMLLAAHLYWQVRGETIPHACLGAIRHALTVGFMTTLILGVGQRILPILGHTLLPWPRLVLPILLLVGLGNLLRVVTELATPVSTAAFALMPLSALLELSALSLFTANALRTLWPARDPLLRTGQVTRSSSVAVLLAEKPWIEDQLFDWGLAYIGRVRSVPRELTLGSMAASEGQSPDEIVSRINNLLRNRPAG